MDLKTLTSMFPSHKLVMGEQFAQETISALKIKAILNWADTIFVNCNFNEAQFHLLTMSGAIFFKCDFSGASFKACDVDASEFISCNLTCCEMLGASFTDTSFTDCVIGGILGPENLSSCAFIYPRYSRNSNIISSIPYVMVTTERAPLYVFNTDTGWRVHMGNQRVNVAAGEVETAQEPYRSAILYASKVMREDAYKLETSMAS